MLSAEVQGLSDGELHESVVVGMDPVVDGFAGGLECISKLPFGRLKLRSKELG